MEDKLIQSALLLGKDIDSNHPLHIALSKAQDKASDHIRTVYALPHEDAETHVNTIYQILERHLQGIDSFPFSYLEMIPIARQLDEMFPRYVNEEHTRINYMGTSDFSHSVAERVLMCYCTRRQEFTDHDPAQFYQTMMLGRDADPEVRQALRRHGGMIYLVQFGLDFLEAQAQSLAHIANRMLDDPLIAEDLNFSLPRTLDDWTEAYCSGLVKIGQRQLEIFQ